MFYKSILALINMAITQKNGSLFCIVRGPLISLCSLSKKRMHNSFCICSIFSESQI